jgi:hypothetical protein
MIARTSGEPLIFYLSESTMVEILLARQQDKLRIRGFPQVIRGRLILVRVLPGFY